MNITPNDIRNTDLPIAMRGYAREAVEDLLEAVSVALEESHLERCGWQEKYHELLTKYNRLAELEETLNSTLIVAKKTADEILQSARNDSERILEETSRNQKRLQHESETRLTSLQSTIIELEKSHGEYQSKLKQLIGQQLKTVEDLGFEFSKPDQSAEFVQEEIGEAQIYETEVLPEKISETGVSETESSIAEDLKAKNSEDSENTDSPEIGIGEEKKEPVANLSINRSVKRTVSKQSGSADQLYKKLAGSGQQRGPQTEIKAATESAPNFSPAPVPVPAPTKTAGQPASVSAPGDDGIIVFGRREDRERAITENSKILNDLDSVIDKFAENLK